MLAIGIAIIIGLLTGIFCAQNMSSLGWSITLGILSFVAVSIALAQFFGRKLKAIVGRVEVSLVKAQEDAMRMAQRLQNKPSGSPKVMQAQIEKQMERGVLEALRILDEAEPLYTWNILAERQVNTVRMQLHFQIRNYSQVDRYSKKILIMEPLTLAMKMVRQYKNNDDEGLEKSYKKGIKKFKLEKGVLIYGLYSWILIKRQQYDKALEVLTEGKEKTKDETLTRNWQSLVNNKPKLVSNAGIGEQWYTLYLEQPPQQRIRKGQTKAHPKMGRASRKRR